MEARGFREGKEIMTTTIATDLVGQVRCSGAHHSDSAKITRCESCGREIVKVRKGKINAKVSGSGYAFTCWSDLHICSNEDVEGWTSEKNYRIAQGQIVAGQIVTVVKGRKVPIGTTGEIRWIGEDSYGNMKVGIRVNEEMVFTALKNVEVAA